MPAEAPNMNFITQCGPRGLVLVVGLGFMLLMWISCVCAIYGKE